jgi:predicted flap endonuclease-1-like 5' DNA nuclease
MLQLVVYLLLAAALGFALGWLIRGGSVGAEERSGDAARLEAAERERERLARELSASERARRDLQGALERVPAEPSGRAGAQADLDVAHRRIAELEGELTLARRAKSDANKTARRTETDGVPMGGAGLGTVQPVGAADPHADAGAPPEQLAGPQGAADDLKLISGIGPSIERMLNGLGIYHFRQIAAFTPANVAWVDRHLRFKGRIEREDWVGQAKTLAVGRARAPT